MSNVSHPIIETAIPSSPKTIQPPTVISAISHNPLLLYTMNSILNHFGNPANVTAAHDIAANLLTKYYQRLTPWWFDGFEEEGPPIDEVVEESSLEKREVDFTGEVNTFYNIDLGEEIFIDSAFVARDSNNDNRGCNDDKTNIDKESGGEGWNRIDTGNDKSKEGESIDSIIAETWARFTKKQKGRLWANYVTGYSDWQTGRLVPVEAFKEPFWNTEGLWTGRWQGSDPVGPCTSDGFNRVKLGSTTKRHGGGIIDRHVVGVNFACGSAYALSGKSPKEEMDVTWRAGMRALALIF